MKRKFSIILVLFGIILISTGCSNKIKYEKYSDSFFETFDTVITVVGYTESEEEFKSYMEKIEDRFLQLHRLYDKYNNYEGINNIKTINDKAGIEPVKVEREIIDLILFSKDWYYKSGEKTNIALGPVISIWSEYREEGMNNPDDARLPPMDLLKEANEYTDIEKVIVDEENSTVYLEDEHMRLDVGAVAKGYAAEVVAKEIQEEGFDSAIINAGGNIRTIGKPKDEIRERWGIGLQNPEESVYGTDSNILDTIFVNDGSVVSSGDYQRYYRVNGKVYHHIIDPHTLMPGGHYEAVTIVTADSGLADLLSTSVFLLDIDKGKELVESLDGVEALWVFKNGEILSTQGMKEIMLSEGASGGK